MNRILFSVMLCGVGHVNSDQPPDWNSYIIQSENKKWSAHLSYLAEKNNPWENEWTLNVYEGFYLSPPSPDSDPSWSTKYLPSGYSGGFLSNDGQTFVYLEHWYSRHRPVVKIFRKACSIMKNGSSFDLDEKKLKKTVSHKIWLLNDGDLTFINKGKKIYIEILTVKGKAIIDASCDNEV